MASIDERIVEMRFDNKDFEKNIKVSMKSLEELKKALELDKAAQSLSNLEKAASGFDLSGIANGIDKINERFSSLGIIGVTALQRLANAAIDAGTNIVRSISVDQINAGMDKYEMRTKSVRTIMAATKKPIEEVEGVLDRLMHYTDETSYDFATMAQTIGKFTSAGVDLDVAERAMEGIANEAAKAGAGVGEANRAMYNFAQALAAGKVQLIDWRSIANANMSTKEFKEQLISAAVSLGTLTKGTDEYSGSIGNVVVNYKSFESTLQKGWLTSDVLLKTLEKYADTSTEFGREAYYAAQKALTFTDAMQAVKDSVSSGWMNSFVHIFGNLEEATELWTNFCNTIIEFTSQFSEARNEMLGQWHELGGYNAMIEAASNIWSVFLGIVQSLKEAFVDIFPPVTGKQLADATKQIRDVTVGLKELFGLKKEKITVETEIENEGYTIEEWTEALKRGAEGSEIQIMQERLMELGHSLDKYGADGIFGPETEAALKAFQREVGIAETGIYDQATRDAFALKLNIPSTTETVMEETEKWVNEVPSGLTNIERIVKGLFAIIDIGKQSLGFVSSIIGHILKILKPVGDAIILVGAVIGDCLVTLDKFIKDSGFFEGVLKSIKMALVPLETFFKRVASAITQFFTSGKKITSFKELWEKLKTSLSKSKVWTSVAKLMLVFKKSLDRVVTTIVQFAKSAASFLGPKLLGVFKGLLMVVPSIIILFVKLIQSVVNVIKNSEKLKSAWEKVKSFFSTFGGAIGKFFQNAWKSVSEFFSNGGILTMWEGIKTAWEGIKKFFVDIGDTIIEKITSIYNNSDFLQKAIAKITESDAYKELSTFLTLVSQAFSDFFGADTSDEKTLKEKLEKRFAAFDPVVDYFKEKIDEIKNSEAYKTISEFLTTVWESLKNFFMFDDSELGGSMIEKLRARLSTFDPVVQWFRDMGASIKQAWEDIKGTGEAMVGEDGAKGIATKIMESIQNFGLSFEGFDLKKAIGPALIAIAAFSAIKILPKVISAFGGIENITKNILEKKGFKFFDNGKKDPIGTTLLKAAGAAFSIAAAVELLNLAVQHMRSLLNDENKEKTIEAFEKVKEFLIALGAIQVASSVPLAFNKGSITQTIPAALGIAAGVWVLVDAMRKMMKLVDKYGSELFSEDENGEGITKLGYAFSTIEAFMISLGAISTVASTFGKNKMSFAGPLAIAFSVKVLVGAMADLLGLMGKYSEGQVNDAFGTIETFMLSIGGIETVGSYFSKGFLSSVGTGGGVYAIAKSVEVLVDALSASLVKIKDIDPSLITTFTSAVDITLAGLATLAGVLAEFGVGKSLLGELALEGLFAALAGGIAMIGNVANDLVQRFSSTLWLIGGRLQSFSNNMANVNTDYFARAVSACTYATKIFALLSHNPANLSVAENFSDYIVEIGGALKQFSSSINGGFKSIAVDKAKDAIKDILDVSDIEIDDSKIDSIVSKIQTISAAITLYQQAVSDASSIASLSDENAEPISSSALGEAFTAISNSIPDSSVISSVSGLAKEGSAQYLGDFSLGIVELGNALETYANTIGGLSDKQEAIGLANSVLDNLTTIEERLTSVNNWDFFGIPTAHKDELTGFATDITNLGTALGNYAKDIGGLNPLAVMWANSVLTTIANLDIPTTGQFWTFLTGSQNLGEFASNVSSLGSGVSEFAEKINEVDDYSNTDAAVSILNTIAAIGKEMDKSGGAAQLINGKVDFGALGQSLVTYGEKLVKFANYVNTAKNFDLNSNAFTESVAMLEKFVGLQTALDANKSGSTFYMIGQDIYQMYQNMTGLGSDKVTEVFNNAYAIAKAFIDGLKQPDLSTPFDIFTTLLDAALTGIEGKDTEFVAAGGHMMGGLAYGIYKNAYLVVDAAYSVANEAFLAACSAVQVASPSRRFMWMGQMLDSGLAIGLQQYAGLATDAASDVSDKSSEAVLNGLRTMNTLISDEINATPTITPVLDLSDISARSGLIGSYFGNQSIGVSSTGMASGISARMSSSESIKSTADDRILDAFNVLNARVNDLGERISNMKVVVESGALIGQIENGIDQRLGDRSVYAERGMM